MPGKRAYLNWERCLDCQACPAAEHCPTGSLNREEPGAKLFVDLCCNGCGTCLRHCPYKALSLL